MYVYVLYCLFLLMSCCRVCGVDVVDYLELGRKEGKAPSQPLECCIM
jgi:hypothetical protein